MLSTLAFILVFLIVWSMLHFTFENLATGYKAAISGGISALLSPRINSYKTQSGEKFQLRWIFLKRVITF